MILRRVLYLDAGRGLTGNLLRNDARKLQKNQATNIYTDSESLNSSSK